MKMKSQYEQLVDAKISRVVDESLVYVRLKTGPTIAIRPDRFRIKDAMGVEHKYGGQSFKALGVVRGMPVKIALTAQEEEKGEMLVDLGQSSSWRIFGF